MPFIKSFPHHLLSTPVCNTIILIFSWCTILFFSLFSICNNKFAAVDFGFHFLFLGRFATVNPFICGGDSKTVFSGCRDLFFFFFFFLLPVSSFSSSSSLKLWIPSLLTLGVPIKLSCPAPSVFFCIYIIFNNITFMHHCFFIH